MSDSIKRLNRDREGLDIIITIARIDQLQNPDDLIVIIDQRNREEGFRPVARAFVEGFGSTEIKLIRLIGILDIDRFLFMIHGRCNIIPLGMIHH